jgi:hypothetical protein
LVCADQAGAVDQLGQQQSPDAASDVFGREVQGVLERVDRRITPPTTIRMMWVRVIDRARSMPIDPARFCRQALVRRPVLAARWC